MAAPMTAYRMTFKAIEIKKTSEKKLSLLLGANIIKELGQTMSIMLTSMGGNTEITDEITLNINGTKTPATIANKIINFVMLIIVPIRIVAISYKIDCLEE